MAGHSSFMTCAAKRKRLSLQSRISAQDERSWSSPSVSVHTATTRRVRFDLSDETPTSTYKRGDILKVGVSPTRASPTLVIVVAVYQTQLITLPIVASQSPSQEAKNPRKLTCMSILPPLDRQVPLIPLKASAPHLYVGTSKAYKTDKLGRVRVKLIRENYSPEPHSTINLLDTMTIYHHDTTKKLGSLDPRSTAILAQRWRIVHNMAYVPLALGEDYFKAMITRDPILAPDLAGNPAEEFYTGGMFEAIERRGSTASVNEDLLLDDLGLGVVRGEHDMEAARRLIEWKPSLRRLLMEEEVSPGPWSPMPSPYGKGRSSISMSPAQKNSPGKVGSSGKVRRETLDKAISVVAAPAPTRIQPPRVTKGKGRKLR